MAEFDYMFVSVLFGVAGTFIILTSNILSHKKKINNENKEKFSLVSQLIGYLFLFNGFLYQLYPKISSWNLIGPIPLITTFSYWPYYLFLLSGIITSLVFVREINFGNRFKVTINPKNKLEFFIFYSSAVFAFLAFIFNLDFFLIITLLVWFKFMQILLDKD